MYLRYIAALATVFMCVGQSRALTLEPIKYGDFSSWVTRDITESKLIGGNHKTVYEIAPTRKITGNEPYVNQGGSPWATSNVYA